MIPTYRYSVSIDLNEDHSHTLFSTNHQASSSSSSFISNSILFNLDQDRGEFCYCQSKHLQSDEEVQKIVRSGGSWDHPVEKIEKSSDLKLRVWKKEEGCENLQGEDSSRKLMPSKMRMRRMMSDHSGSDRADISSSKYIKYEEKNQPLSPLVTDDSNYNSSSNQNNVTARVCSDCHTTKTPLWRSGPKGPKSLCNACGIRQRKARRAMAASATTANGRNLVEAEKSEMKKGNKLQRKGVKPKAEGVPVLLKKKPKPAKHKKRLGAFEDLTVRLNKNLALQQVFHQDEKEAAILLMALSYGLLHGFPSDRYIT